MNLPFFFVEELENAMLTLDENISRHIVNVLRMQKGQEILLTNGRGQKAKACIVDNNRKKCIVEISLIETNAKSLNKVAIGISLIKNSSRFEWLLEKATEIGVGEIIPLICARTEKEKFRHDRMQNILISAMLQSQQFWLPFLHQPTAFDEVLQKHFEKKFIAHCEDSNKQPLSSHQLNTSTSKIILIGPEGDFTSQEIEKAFKSNFVPVSLGNTRLRTETAAIVAAALLCIH